jgi:hypothetical protein
LNALFPAVMTGMLAEVIVADAGSRDATAEVADVAGCAFLRSDGPLGARLKGAVTASRGAWLLFLPAGSVLDAGWVDAAQAFMASGNADRAATFRANKQGWFGAFLGKRKPEHGLLIARRTYDALGGHDTGENADTALLRKLRHLDTLPALVTVRRYT